MTLNWNGLLQECLSKHLISQLLVDSGGAPASSVFV